VISSPRKWSGFFSLMRICGAPVASGRTIIVDDVNADTSYLSCLIKTKSEIVVPIYTHD
jgi:L-methionine (R)-S-oxide reductase